jgi:hypothetical protein
MMFRFLVKEHSNTVQFIFDQLYTLHAFQNGQYIPCVFFLLPRKNKECYIEMFQYLLDVCTQENLKIRAARKNFPLGRKESDNVRQKLELKTNYQDGQLTRLQYVKRMVFKALPVS